MFNNLKATVAYINMQDQPPCTVCKEQQCGLYSDDYRGRFGCYDQMQFAYEMHRQRCIFNEEQGIIPVSSATGVYYA